MSENRNPNLPEKLFQIRKASNLAIRHTPLLKKEIMHKGVLQPLKLMNYQVQMVFHLLMMKRFVVGDDAGLGKTLETIATLCYLWEKEPDLMPVIVTNTSVTSQWGGEFDKFTNGVRWTIVEGSPEKRSMIYQKHFEDDEDTSPKVLITNYHRLRRDRRQFLESSKGHRIVLVLDEVTAVKSESSQTHVVFKEFAMNAERVYGLTATLIKNNLLEGYGIFKVVQPNLFGSLDQFYRDYCITRKQKAKGKKYYVPVVVGHSPDHIRKFRETIEPFYLGRPRHLVADDLPVLTTKDIHIPLEHSQWQYYKDAVQGLLVLNEGLEDEVEKETTKLTSLAYCQQITDSPSLIGNDVKSGKEEFFYSLIEEEFPDEKVIVFTRFRGMVDRFQEVLEKKGYGLGIQQESKNQWEPVRDNKKRFVRVTGSEDTAMRDAARRAFTETDNTNIIFITLAGAEAINLQQAKILIFYDLPWSAGDYLQCVGRMIRIGSPHERVYAIHLIGEGPNKEPTIDSHVLATLNKKMGWIESTLGERLVKEDSEDVSEIFSAVSEISDIFESIIRAAQSLK